MDNQKKDRNLRVLLITLCQSSADATPAAIPYTLNPIARGLMRQGVEVSAIALIPWLPGREPRAVPKAADRGDSADSQKILETHAIRWPGYARKRTAQLMHFWPGAGFAFPFIGAKLVDLVHAQKPDILLANDLEISGHVAWRLYEITGVPYVIMDNNIAHSARITRKPSALKRLHDIGVNAQYVLHQNAANTAAINAIFPGMRLQMLPTSESAEIESTTAKAAGALAAAQLVEILHAAIRQSQVPFDW